MTNVIQFPMPKNDSNDKHILKMEAGLIMALAAIQACLEEVQS